MGGFEWFLLIVVVILVPLVVAGAVTLWTLEQARKRNRRNRTEGQGKRAGVARKATRPDTERDESQVRDAMSKPGEGRRRDDPAVARREEPKDNAGRDGVEK